MAVAPSSSRSATGGGSAIASLFTSTLGAPAASIDTGAAGIALSATHLMVVAHLRADVVATTTAATLRLNNDSGANYFVESLEAFGVSVNGFESLAATAITLEAISAASAPASVFTPVTLVIPNYASGTPKKSLNGLAGYRTGSASGNILAKAMLGYWDSVAAITRLAFICTGGNFIAGSTVSVYGLA